jgi:excisionase family DNA binding protein
MSKGRRDSDSSERERLGDREWPEVMKLRQAAEYLGVSHTKITMMVHGGMLPFSRSEMDYRVKLVKKSDLDELKRKSRPE